MVFDGSRGLFMVDPGGAAIILEADGK